MQRTKQFVGLLPNLCSDLISFLYIFFPNHPKLDSVSMLGRQSTNNINRGEADTFDEILFLHMIEFEIQKYSETEKRTISSC